MATLYRVATGTWTATNAFATSSGGMGSVTGTTSTDNVIFDTNTPTDSPITITGAISVRSLDFTSYTGNVTHGANSTLSIGDATPGLNNIALKMSPGMTFTANSTTTSIVSLISTSNIEQGITMAGKTLGRLQIDGIDCNYTQLDDCSVAGNMVLTYGSWNMNNHNITCSILSSNNTNNRAFIMGSGTVNITATSTSNVVDILTSTGLSFSGENGTINIASQSVNNRSIRLNQTLGNLIYNNANSSGSLTLAGSSTYRNITLADSAGAKSLVLTANTMTTVDNLNLQGSINGNISLRSSSTGINTYLKIIGNPITNLEYITAQDVYSIIPNKLYLGSNSVDSGNNINISFSPYAPVSLLIWQEYESATATTQHDIKLQLPPPAGSLLIFSYLVQGNPGTITPPAGANFIETHAAGTGIAQVFIYEKIADGSEIDLTLTTTILQTSAFKVMNISGWNGTPTFDVSSKNTSGAASTNSLISHDSLAPSNTGTPAYALYFISSNSSLSLTVDITNGFIESRQSPGTTHARYATKLLTSNGPVETTITWTTSRRATGILVIYKDEYTGVPTKVKIAGTFTSKPVKLKKSGSFAEKSIKVKKNGSF